MIDGGFYDNLGLSPLLPGRSKKYTNHAYDLEYVIAIDAGIGRTAVRAPNFWPGRMKRRFGVLLDHVELAEFGLEASGRRVDLADHRHGPNRWHHPADVDDAVGHPGKMPTGNLRRSYKARRYPVTVPPPIGPSGTIRTQQRPRIYSRAPCRKDSRCCTCAPQARYAALCKLLAPQAPGRVNASSNNSRSYPQPVRRPGGRSRAGRLPFLGHTPVYQNAPALSQTVP